MSPYRVRGTSALLPPSDKAEGPNGWAGGADRRETALTTGWLFGRIARSDLGTGFDIAARTGGPVAGIEYILADVFTDRPLSGNPLAVFPDADGLTDATLQAIAAELNLSESVFVSKPENPAHAARLRIFTPRYELPFAGHPTVGAACMLAAEGRFGEAVEQTVVFEEVVGPVPVRIGRSERGARATLSSPRIPEPVPIATSDAELAKMLSLDVVAIDRRAGGPAAYSAGVPFLFVPLLDRRALGQIRIDGGAWQRVLADSPAPHLYAIVSGEAGAETVIHARMFAPAMGIPEDPATGAAAAALPGFLGGDLGDGVHRWRIEQGVEMGRPSVLEVEAERRDGRFVAVRVGGAAVRVGRGRLEL